MEEFVAIALICRMSLAPSECTEATAQDVMSVRVHSELGCITGWQDVVARSALAKDIGTTSYLKTLCRRTAPATEGEGR